MNLRKLPVLLFVLLACCLISHAQNTVLSVGAASALTIKSGTIFSADSLVLIPGADFTLASNAILQTATPVATNPSPTINRVYYLNTPINFTGTIQVYYQPSELNGNTEATLFLTDSTVSSTWTSEMTSTVNTASHFVQLVAASQSFNGASASGTIIPLPLNLISFAGAWNGNTVGLDWLVEQSDETATFDVESSSDGASWKQIGEVPGVRGNGLFKYDFRDENPASDKMYYRIKIILASGGFSYSYLVNVNKGQNNADIRLLVHNHAVSVYFMGNQPSAIRLINALGQVLRVDKISGTEYDLNGLFPGAYFLQYEINGQWAVRRFIAQ